MAPLAGNPLPEASENVVSAGPAPDGLWFWCPLRLEARAARRGAKASQVSRSGMGPRKSAAFVEQLHTTLKYQESGRQVVIVGFGGGLNAQDKPGDVVVASQVCGPGEAFEFPQAGDLTAMLSSHGLPARSGVLHSADHVVLGKQRHDLSATGADVVEMESWWLLQAAQSAAKAGQPPVPMPQAVIRVLLDTPQRSLLGAVPGIRSVSHILSRAAAALEAITLSAAVSPPTSSPTSAAASPPISPPTSAAASPPTPSEVKP